MTDTGFKLPILAVSEDDGDPKRRAIQELVFPAGSLAISGTKATVDISVSPAGNDTEVQFNSSGAFGADTDFTYASNQLRLNNSSAGAVSTALEVTNEADDNINTGVAIEMTQSAHGMVKIEAVQTEGTWDGSDIIWNTYYVGQYRPRMRLDYRGYLSLGGTAAQGSGLLHVRYTGTGVPVYFERNASTSNFIFYFSTDISALWAFGVLANSDSLHFYSYYRYKDAIQIDRTDLKVGINVAATDDPMVGQLEVNSLLTTTPTFIARAAASQTANLSEWRNSSDTVLTYIEPDGEIVIDQDSKGIKFGADQDITLWSTGAGDLVITPLADTDITLTFTGTTNSGTLKWMEDEDYFQFENGIKIDGSSDINQLVVEANATQTNPLILINNSSSTELIRIDSDDQTNLFVGYNAGNSNDKSGGGVTGINNTFIGSGAGASNTSGYRNVYVGWNAGASATTSANNVFIGYGAGASIVGGSAQTFIGLGAGNLTTGSANTFIGSTAGNTNVAGSSNTAIGDGAGPGGSGSSNTSIGKGAGNYGNSASNCVNIGLNAGQRNVSANSNINIGASAGLFVTGTNNITIGTSASYYQQTGTGNVVIGNAASQGGAALHSKSGSVHIGHNAGYSETASNTLYIANSNTTTPLIYGLFSGTGAGITIYSQATDGVPLTIKGKASQSSNLQEWKDSSGNLIHAAGDGLTGSEWVINEYGTDIDFRVEGDTEDHLLTVDAGEDVVRLGDWDTNYMEVDKTGDVAFVGGGGLQFAEISYGGSGFDTALAAQDTDYQITGFDTDGVSNGATPDHTNDHITISKAGMYLVSYSVSCRSAQSNDYEFKVKKNNGATDHVNSHTHRVTSSADALGVVSLTCILDLAASDTIEMWVMRTDGAAVSKTITIEHITFLCTQIGGT